MGRKLWFSLVALAFLIVLSNADLAHAQSQTYYWKRFDVDLTAQSNGDLRVVETQEFVFTSGSFRRVYANIPLDKIERVTNVRATGDGRIFTQGTGNYTYSTSVDSQRNEFNIELHFPPVSNSTHLFVIEYTAVGAVRIYPDGDQVWWKAIGSEHSFAIQSSTVTVHLPEGTNGNIKTESYGAKATSEQPDGQTVVFSAQNISSGQELEVRVQFPHGLIQAQPPAWQAAADSQAAWDETWRPVANLASGALALLLLIGGNLGAYLLWYTRGRDAPVGLVADTIAEPPDELPPGVVGTLLDESAEMREIIATIVDLARRGVIKMIEMNEPGFLGIGSRRDFTFELLQSDATLRQYEQTLIRRLFDGRQQIKLSSLKEKFYTAIPTLRDQLYEEVVKVGFFRRSPAQTRQIYTGVGIGMIALSSLVGLVALIALRSRAELVLCVPAAMLVVSVALIIVGRFMPRRTPEGAMATAKWRAFKRYLENIDKYQKLDEAKEIFDKYLPYAIAFGLEQGWVQKFASVETPAPAWYETMPPVGGPPYRPYRPRPGYGTYVPGSHQQGSAPSGQTGGHGQPPQIPDLQTGSDSMARGLQGMSGGLAAMLNVAGAILSSAPRSSGGGGGWSGGGGGFGGGGGGGGGARGAG